MHQSHRNSRPHRRPAGRLVLACLLVGGLTVALGRNVINASARPLHDRINQAMHLAQSNLVEVDGVNPNPGVAQSIVIPIEGQELTLELEPHSVRTEGYRLLVQEADGSVVDREPGVERTLRGAVAEIPGSVAAGAVSVDGGLHATVLMPDGEQYWIEPAAAYVGDAPLNTYVVYRSDDALPGNGVCGNLADAEPLVDGGEAPVQESGGPGDIHVMQLACDADVEYFNAYGTVVGTEARIHLIIGTVNLQYESQCQISHLISAIIVRTSEPDPYSSTNNNILLSQFRTQWNTNHGDIQRDGAHLFTGKEIDGAVIGTAWGIGVMCIISANYCFAQSDCCDIGQNISCATDLTAHELGHLWGATHCSCSGSTMNAVQDACSNNFVAVSINQIIAERDSVGCLEIINGSAGLPFADSFPGTSFDPVRWSNVTDATINGNAINEPSPPNSVNLDSTDQAVTSALNADGLCNISVSYWYESIGNEAGDDLYVEYFDAGGRWQLIAQHLGSDPDMTDFAQNQVTLDDVSAAHPFLAVRFRADGDDGSDNWYVDDLDITADPAPVNGICVNAFLINADAPEAFDTSCAVTDGFSEGACGSTPLNDIWFGHLPPCGESMIVTLSDLDFNAAVAIYENFPCPEGPDEAIACFQSPQTSIAVPVTTTSYRIRVGGVNGEKGTGTLTMTCGTPPACAWDCDGSGDDAVNVSDLLALLGQYDTTNPPCDGGGSCDFDGSGCVDVGDLLKLLAHYDPAGVGCP